MAPVVYSEENDQTLIIDTVVGEFEIPKFDNYKQASQFLKVLSEFIHERPNFQRFWIKVTQEGLIKEEDYKIVKVLFDRLYVLHRSKILFWPIIYEIALRLL